MHCLIPCLATLSAVCYAQLIAPGSRWTLDGSFFESGNPFIAKFGNSPTTCRDKTTNATVPCKQIHILHALFMNAGPVHISFALNSGLHMAAKWINEDQLMLPGHELVIHSRDTRWSAVSKDMIVADEILNASGKYVGTLASFNLDGGFVYLLNKLRMPLLTGNIGQQMADPALMPAGFSAVNHAGHALDPIDKVFQKCSWKHVGIIYDPVQFSYEAEKFKPRMEARGYTVDFFEELNNLNQLDNVLKVLKRSGSRVVMVFAEALPIVWLSCAMHLQEIGRILIMQWPGIPWFLNAGDAQDDRCKNPNVLIKTLKNNYIGWYPLTMDGSPTTKPLTCHPNKPRAQAQGEVMGYMGETLAAAGVPFGAVAHLAGGFDPVCLLVLYLRHMLFTKSYTVEQIAARTPEIYDEYLNWAWPPFHGASGEMFFDKIYDSNGYFVGQRNTNLEIIQITGEDFTKSPYLNSPPPWDVGMVSPGYTVNPDGSVVDGFLSGLTFEDGTNCPADRFDACPTGQELVLGHCVDCAPGQYLGPEGECLPCLVGMYQHRSGQLLCLACPLGEYSNATGASKCVVCEPGSSRPEGIPATLCLPCAAGSFTTAAQQTEETGMAKCRTCPEATYTAALGSMSCVPCPMGFTTKFRGSEGASACQCGEGSYNSGSSCQACPEGLTCPFASEEDSALAAARPFLKPGFWSSPDDPLKAFHCESDELCPGGEPGKACGPHLVDRACADCELGFIMVGHGCVACTPFERSAILFPIIPLTVGPAIVVGMYMTSRQDVQYWKHWRNGISGVGFVVLNHYQMVNILRSVGITTPTVLENTLSVWKVASDVLSVFKPPCMGFSNYMHSLTMKALGPVIVFVIFLGTYAGSHVLALRLGKACGMKRALVLNAYFSVMFSFFASIAQVSFVVMNCARNPSAKWTLLADRSVICFEGDWMPMLVVGILSILFWCLGFGALFSRAIYVAPRYWDNLGFRMRWKFLFIKFRTGLGWFSMTIVVKGVMTNIGFIFLSDPLMQIYWTLMWLALYLGLVGIFKPWRLMAINILDLCSHLCLVFLGFMLTWYIEQNAAMDSIVSVLSILVSFLTLCASVPTVLYMAASQRLGRFTKQKAAAMEEVRLALAFLTSMDLLKYQSLMGSLTDFEVGAFLTAARAVPARDPTDSFGPADDEPTDAVASVMDEPVDVIVSGTHLMAM
eukprot:CAMPEP_0203936032 /NCGR_PEP_ID=MMETSP0359-20131031/73670_1 /ASSEMBLY_ACC=CAM_ASM_000338 /TAXON_ID=268821 /ORGANISM="Scrippsiella Hangoei, Strain SHTV-5" /LENGTH=1188 /DNA_ID=CAMNT_0050865947 /DNA_START=115 /DNA_END=3681 /DNA_ORIENTATION=-